MQKPITEEQKKELEYRFTENNVGFKDKFAMAVAAAITIVLPCALILGGIGLLALFVFGAL